jgi:hypothetical protein
MFGQSPLGGLDAGGDARFGFGLEQLLQLGE